MFSWICFSDCLIQFFFSLLGHSCPSGSHTPVRCNSGTYQDETGQGSCKTCPAGYFCDNTLNPVVLFNSSICPQGQLKNQFLLCSNNFCFVCTCTHILSVHLLLSGWMMCVHVYDKDVKKDEHTRNVSQYIWYLMQTWTSQIYT